MILRPALLLTLVASACSLATAATVYRITSFSACEGCSAESFGINDHGLATGSTGTDGVIYNGSSSEVVTIPGDPDGEGGFAKPSNAGLIPVFKSASDGSTQSFSYRQGGSFTPLPSYPGSLATYAMQFGGGNEFVGFYSLNLLNYQGFLYNGSGFESISDPTRPDGTTFILGINSAGTVIGFSEDSTGLNTRGVIRVAGGSVEAFNLPGALESAPQAINDKGEIVGTYRNSTGWHGFVYDDGASKKVYNTMLREMAVESDRT
jgi:hypothetical protein